MFTWLHVVLNFAHSIALIALLAVAYGTVRRNLGSEVRANLLLGALFGLAAVIAMFDPVVFAPGIFVDMRSVTVALAGGYLGPAGAAAALAISAPARLAIGGAGAISGAVGLTIATLAGLAWAKWAKRQQRIALPQLTILGLMSSLGLTSFVLLPSAVATDLMRSLGPLIIIMNAAGVVLCGLVLQREKRLMQVEDGLRETGMTDALTGLFNRRGFEAAHRLSSARIKPNLGQGMLLIDIDHFKGINDTFGHTVGDQVLRRVADCLHQSLQPGANLGRIGGEEFAVDVHTPTQAQTADFAETLRAAVAGLAIPVLGHADLRVSVSIGAHWAQRPISMSAALSAADDALYRAKRAGRDRVAIAA